MLQKIYTLTRKYNAEIAAINPDYKDSVKETLKREIDEKFSTAIGPCRAALRRDAENLHAELEDAMDPAKQLARLAVGNHANVTPGIQSIIQSLPGLPNEMLSTLIDQATSPALQLGIYSQIAAKDGKEAASMRSRLMKKVAVNREQIQNLANAEKRHWMALADATSVPGDDSYAKLNYGHSIAPLDKILAD